MDVKRFNLNLISIKPQHYIAIASMLDEGFRATFMLSCIVVSKQLFFHFSNEISAFELPFHGSADFNWDSHLFWVPIHLLLGLWNPQYGSLPRIPWGNSPQLIRFFEHFDGMLNSIQFIRGYDSMR